MLDQICIGKLCGFIDYLKYYDGWIIFQFGTTDCPPLDVYILYYSMYNYDINCMAEILTPQPIYGTYPSSANIYYPLIPLMILWLLFIYFIIITYFKRPAWCHMEC